MRKLNIEIHPHACRQLSPRYHISKNAFEAIRKRKMEEFNKKCEACGKADEVMQLHESGVYKSKCYIFQGFYLLCRKCHYMVHCFSVGSNVTGVTDGAITVAFRLYPITKRSVFKSRATLTKSIVSVFDGAFEFTMSDRVGCDYSKAKDYGLDPDQLKSRFEAKYDHFNSRIRYMGLYVNGLPFREAQGDYWFYKSYKYPEKIRRWETVLHKEYIRHKDFYDAHIHILEGVSSPERDKLILEYAAVMKSQINN